MIRSGITVTAFVSGNV